MRIKNILITVGLSSFIISGLSYIFCILLKGWWVSKLYLAAAYYLICLLCLYFSIIGISFIVPRIFNVAIYCVQKSFGFFSLFLVFTAIYLASKSAENMFEELYQKFSQFVEIPRGLDPSSTIEPIVQGHQPLYVPAIEDISEDAIIIIHGAQQSPRRMSNIYSSPAIKKMDRYLPLLLFHRRSTELMDKIDYHQMSRQLLEDVLFVSKQHNGNVFCFGHSLAGSLLCYLSLRGELPENVKLILYAPAIQTEIGYLKYSLAWFTSYFNKYVIHPEIFSKRVFKFGYNFAEFLTSKKLLLVLFRSSRVLKQMLSSNEMQNDFVCIISENDKRTPSAPVISLLKNQKRLKDIILLNQGGHSPHLDDQHSAIICEALLKAIRTLKNK